MNSPSVKKSVLNRISLLAILILLLAFTAAGASAATRGVPTTTTSPFEAPRVITTVTTAPVVACPAPCACMERSAAAAAWGADGFTQCAELPCSYEQAASGVLVEKYCFRQKVITSAPTTIIANQPVDVPVVITTTQTYAQMVNVPVITTPTVPKVVIPQDLSKVCPGDSDCDGRPDNTDNCPSDPNMQHVDSDSYTLFSTCKGTACKIPDTSNCEGIPGTPLWENCFNAAWKKANPNGCDTGQSCQKSSDGYGDACDTCWEVQDSQADTDGDCANLKLNSAYWSASTGWKRDPLCGDACDRCPGSDDSKDADKDEVPDGCDKCPGSDDSKDADKDGVPDACDTCWYRKNPSNAENDGDCAVLKLNTSLWDGTRWLADPRCGDACDNCPSASNPEQWDTNNDGAGDACSCTWCTSSRIRPVYITGTTGKSIDIVLVPSASAYDMDTKGKVWKDTYNKSETDFRDVVKDNIRNGYLRLDSYSTSPVKSDFRQRFNIYYYWDPLSVADAHGTCGGTLPPAFAADAPFRDAAIILYPEAGTKSGNEAIGGCSAGLGTPVRITAPGFFVPTLLHESGHGVFGLVDTYCSVPNVDTTYSQHDPYSNVWISLANCQQAPASQYGNLNPVDCRRIEAVDPATPKNPDCSIDFWRWDPDPDNMRDCGFSSRFGKASVRRINYVFDSYSSM